MHLILLHINSSMETTNLNRPIMLLLQEVISSKGIFHLKTSLSRYFSVESATEIIKQLKILPQPAGLLVGFLSLSFPDFETPEGFGDVQQGFKTTSIVMLVLAILFLIMYVPTSNRQRYSAHQCRWMEAAQGK
jgi:hypothetical protein